jgi:hypothetical protein
MNTDKDFAPYQPSLDMKELGFDEPCLSYFDSRLEHQIGNFDFREVSGYKESTSALSPLYQQAFRWFREKHNLLNDVGISAHRRNDVKKWMYSIIYLDKNTYIYSEETYNTYEEAESACLDRLIEIVKNNNK